MISENLFTGHRYQLLIRTSLQEVNKMRLSSILAPTTRNNPAKVKDQRLIRLVKAGYAVYDNSAEEILLTPLGVGLLAQISGKLKGTFENTGIQEISGNHNEAAFALVVRVLKTKDQLPMILMEEKNRNIQLTAFSAVEDDVSTQMETCLQSCREALLPGGIRISSLKEIVSSGERIAMVVEGDKKALGSRDGLVCPTCGWKGFTSSPMGRSAVSNGGKEELEEIYTPGATTIVELCRQLDLPPSQTLKTMFYAMDDGTGQIVVALMRGDRDISLEKLSFYLGGVKLRRATENELKDAVGEVAGFCGPIGLPEEITVVADESVEGAINLAAGANKPDFHFRGACWERDFKADMVRDIAAFGKDSPCPSCGGMMDKGYFTEIGAFYSTRHLSEDYPSLTYINENREKCYPQVWRGTIDLEQLLLSVMGYGSDNLAGWSAFDIHLISALSREDALFTEVEDLYLHLSSKNFRILFDDRDKKINSKLDDSIEMGIPVKVLAGKDTLGGMELEVWTSEREGIILSSEDLEKHLFSLK